MYFNRGAWRPRAKTGLERLWNQDELADFDGDGDLDPWRQSILNPGIESTGYRSLGDGTFAWFPMVMSPLPSGESARGPRILGDFDGDGDTDVILGVLGTSLHEGLWKNNAGGGFFYSGPCTPAGVQFPLSYSYRSNDDSLVGDLQGDGDLDLLHDSGIYLNDGTGFLEPFLQTSVHFGALADIDQDGLLDAVGWGPPVTASMGLPKGSTGVFGPPQTLFSAPGPCFVADFNQDGFPDMAVRERVGTRSFDFQPRVWINGLPLGLGLTFIETRPTSDAIESSNARPSALDANGDGLMDLFFGPSYGNDRAFRVYLQKATAGPLLGLEAFEPGVELVLPGNTLYLPGGATEVGHLRDDVDGDGDVDLLSEYLSLNVTSDGPPSGARRQYGSGSPGTGGIVPVLGAAGPFRLGETAELRITGAGGNLALLGIGPAPASIPDYPFPGTTLLVDPAAGGFRVMTLQVLGSANGPGEGRVTFPFPVVHALVGLTRYHQVFVRDPGAAHGFAASNGLALTFAAP